MSTKAVIVGYLILNTPGCMGPVSSYIAPPAIVFDSLSACKFAKDANAKMAKITGLVADATVCVYLD